MKFGQKITLNLLFFVILCNVAFAQVVDIPDPNLRLAITETLNLPAGAELTQQNIVISRFGFMTQDVVNHTFLAPILFLKYNW